ncbi:hypothetical protein BE17_33935 [Sorangium cellulosum]|uniref:Uncharacterized protein n=1 Tax=Sorangium cellulosum TaxID=56 RepID=A0A150R4W6_SORCE|nr:hypothetical protein BE17_33935 [Sorangium cellulosum]
MVNRPRSVHQSEYKLYSTAGCEVILLQSIFDLEFILSHLLLGEKRVFALVGHKNIEAMSQERPLLTRWPSDDATVAEQQLQMAPYIFFTLPDLFLVQINDHRRLS